ncbi:TPA: hypothetical protein N0F65_001794 [Lagenidium giganteum]|uniref:Hyaluronan/mRNA-binding protein domain-containing protein n=1 Tax=Lagenidium giganteum TaxID=4803 RepID=A0AAV2Z7A8_9STRA|nr:TPA: hypothetical protein N0F65_001794 [Lagenidium giganteum]
MASRSNIFAYLDSDDEDTPKQQNKKQVAPPSAAVALNKPAAGNKKAPKKNAVDAENKGEKKEFRAPREGGEGRRGGRGGRGGARSGAPRRDFERRSGTGRGKETSKQGGGARNWGNDNDQTELAAEAAVQEGAKVLSDEETPVAAEEVEEEEVQFTLDEYLAKKKSERSGALFAEVEARTIDEDFSGARQLTKDGKTPDFIEAQYEKVFSKKTSGRKKNLITDLGFHSAPPSDRRTRDSGESTHGRGGRGRGPAGAGRGRGAAAGRGRGSNVPNVGDLNAFPSL